MQQKNNSYSNFNLIYLLNMINKKIISVGLIFIAFFVSFFLYFKNTQAPSKTVPVETKTIEEKQTTTNIQNSTEIKPEAKEEPAKKIESIAKKQLIFIGIDGMQMGRYSELLANGTLPNFNKIISNGGEDGYAVITGHEITSTAPGNAELHTGLNFSLTKIVDNTCGTIIPKGKTIFERLYNFNSKIILGSIYGKQSCYIPLSLLSNAKPIISWWQDNNTYMHKNYVTDTCADSIDVVSKSMEFIKNNKNNSFYLFIYLGAPDCAGHAFGTTTLEYDKSIINVDDSLGILLNEISSFKIKPQIIISGDHGWNSSSKNHNVRDDNTIVVGLITNNKLLIDKNSERKQCDIAPTILSYFGMESNLYEDIIQNGCESLFVNQ